MLTEIKINFISVNNYRFQLAANLFKAKSRACFEKNAAP